MFDHKGNDLIDAGLEINRAEQKRIEGERGPSTLREKRRPISQGLRAFIFIAFICSGFVGTITYKYVKAKDEGIKKEQMNERQVASSYVPKPVESSTHDHNKNSPHREHDELLNQRTQQRMLSSPLYNPSDIIPETADTEAKHSLRKERILSNKLEPLRLSNATASHLVNRDFLITQGNMIDCVLETRIMTTQPGMTSCHLTRDIYSTSGRVILLDRGSKVTGYYQSGIRQGQARVFVTWNRVETPEGVIINLDSPGTGSLGEAGLGGNIDTHFWERFGGSIMLSLIGDFGDWLSEQGKSQGNHSIQFNNITNGTEQAAIEALQNSINIPPTLSKNQGERVSIFIARDLDFSDVYDLETTN